jgi:hypothetical protein
MTRMRNSKVSINSFLRLNQLAPVELIITRLAIEDIMRILGLKNEILIRLGPRILNLFIDNIQLWSLT